MSGFVIPFYSMASIAKKHKKKNKTLVQWFEKRSLQELSDFSEKRAYAQGFSGKSLWLWFFHRKELISMIFTKKGG